MTVVSLPSLSLSPPARRAVLSVHIAGSGALLGDAAGFLAVAIRSASAGGDGARAGWDTLNMFSLVFGIPLSLVALITGAVLGIGTRWGVFRYPWVTLKLLLILAVMVVGTTVLGPGLDAARRGLSAGEAMLIAGAGFDVVALLAATVLSVYKPGASWRADRPRQHRAPR